MITIAEDPILRNYITTTIAENPIQPAYAEGNVSLNSTEQVQPVSSAAKVLQPFYSSRVVQATALIASVLFLGVTAFYCKNQWETMQQINELEGKAVAQFKDHPHKDQILSRINPLISAAVKYNGITLDCRAMVFSSKADWIIEEDIRKAVGSFFYDKILFKNLQIGEAECAVAASKLQIKECVDKAVMDKPCADALIKEAESQFDSHPSKISLKREINSVLSNAIGKDSILLDRSPRNYPKVKANRAIVDAFFDEIDLGKVKIERHQ
jgi:hypothetical protein